MIIVFVHCPHLYWVLSVHGLCARTMMKTCWNCDLQNIVNEKVNILCVIDNI